MNLGRKSSLAAMVVLAFLLGLGSAAGACSTTFDQEEYMVVFQRGITWQAGKSEVASWGNSWQLTVITSKRQERYVEKFLGGLKGEFWLGGYQNDTKKQKWHWTSGEDWKYTDWAKGEPDRKSGKYLAIGRNNSRNPWMWYDEDNGRGISGFLVERHLGNPDPHGGGPVPVPIPSAALLLGSVMAMMGGFSFARKKEAC